MTPPPASTPDAPTRAQGALPAVGPGPARGRPGGRRDRSGAGAEPRRSGALTTRGHSFAASGVALLVAGYALGLADLARLGLLLGALALLALLVARRAPDRLDVRRVITPATPVVGDPTEVRLRVLNPAAHRTTTLVATELLPRALGDRPRFLLPALRPGDHGSATYTVTPRARGELVLGPLTVQVRDGFGLTTRDVPAGGRHTLLVHPRPVPLPGSALGASDAGGEGGPAHGVAANGADDLSVREYRYGDELRRIHWKATAHMGELMVRQEERPARRAAVVLLDSRARAHSGQDESATFEWAVTCAASVVRHLEELGLHVVLVCDETCDSVRSSSASPDDPMAVLARARTGDDDTFARCVQAADEVATAGAVVVAVLGTDPEEDSDGPAPTRHPASRGIALVVTDGAGRGRRADAADRTAAQLARRGWLTTIATPRTDVAAAWEAVTGRGQVTR